MCFGSDDPPPTPKRPVSPLTTTPMPDQGAPDVVAARVRERHQLDAMAGYRSTFVSGPRGPGGPSLADQRSQLDVTSALPASDPNAVAPPPLPGPPPGTSGGSGGGSGDGSGPSDGDGNFGDPGTLRHANLTIDNGGTPKTSWWKPKPRTTGGGFYGV